jgi:hypothetical protein
MGILDFLLYPFYLLLFYFIFRTRRLKLNDPVLQFYHKQGFWIKALAVLPFTIFNTYLSVGDSFGLYYTEGVNIHNLIISDLQHLKWIFLPGNEFDQALLKNPLNQGYFRIENNYMVTRLVTIFAFFSFSRYLIINLFFAMLAFSGVWRLYRFFYSLYPHLHKQLAIAILYLPTVIFWSSGILKDSICMGALGWITYSLYEILFKKNRIFINTIIVVAAGYMLVIVKVYILVSYLPFFGLFLFLKNISNIRSTFLKVFIVFTLIITSLSLFTQIMSKFKETLGEYGGESITKSVERHQSAYANKEATSSFSLGVEFDGSLLSLIKIGPAAIIATLYRPFLWESRNLTTLLSSFESLFIIIFTLSVLFIYGPFHFVNVCIKNPTVIYCILFSLLFAMFVGATTPNFGSLVRYKIPCMPFYLIALFLIQDEGKKKKENLLNNKQVIL